MADVYVIRQTGTDFIKIGFSTNSEERLRNLQTANPQELVICDIYSFDDAEQARWIESHLHQHFSSANHRGEWFKLNPQKVAEAVPDAIALYEAMTHPDEINRFALPTVWCIYPHHDQATYELFLNQSLMGLNFSNLGDLSKLEPTTEAFRLAWEKKNPHALPGQVRAFYPMLYSFVHRVQINDLVLYPPTWREPKIHVGRVTSNYVHTRWAFDGYRDRRSVEWFSGLARRKFSKTVLRGIRVNLAFFQVRSEFFLERLQELL